MELLYRHSTSIGNVTWAQLYTFSAAFLNKGQGEELKGAGEGAERHRINSQYETYLTVYQDSTGTSTDTDVTSFCCLACNRYNVWEGQDQCLPIKNVSSKRFYIFQFCLEE